MTKIYKPIKGYENIYNVANDGEVKNIITGRILKQSVDTVKNGYLKTKHLIARAG